MSKYVVFKRVPNVLKVFDKTTDHESVGSVKDNIIYGGHSPRQSQLDHTLFHFHCHLYVQESHEGASLTKL